MQINESRDFTVFKFDSISSTSWEKNCLCKNPKTNTRNKSSLWCLCLLHSASCTPVCHVPGLIILIGAWWTCGEFKIYIFLFLNSFFSSDLHRSQCSLIMDKEHWQCGGQILKEGWGKRQVLSIERDKYVLHQVSLLKKNVKRSEKYSSCSSWLNAVILSLRAQKPQFSI